MLSIPPACDTFTPCSGNATTCAAAQSAVTFLGSDKIIRFATNGTLTVSANGAVLVLLVGDGASEQGFSPLYIQVLTLGELVEMLLLLSDIRRHEFRSQEAIRVDFLANA